MNATEVPYGRLLAPARFRDAASAAPRRPCAAVVTAACAFERGDERGLALGGRDSVAVVRARGTRRRGRATAVRDSATP